jgi:adenylate cyclase
MRAGPFHLLAPLIVVATALGLRLADPPALREIRARAFDGFQALRPRAFADAPVRIIAIDDESLRRHGQWPWPRVLIARLVEKLQDAGAAAIAFDVIFAEPDRTSPARLLPLLPKAAAEALEAAAASAPLPDHDRIFAEAIARGGVVTAFAISDELGTAPPIRKAALSIVGEKPTGYVLTHPGAVSTLPALAEAAAGNGSVTVRKDRDAILRRIPLVIGVGDEIYPSLALEALRVGQGAAGIVIKVSGAAGVEGSGGDTGVQAVKVGDVVLPTDPRGRLLIHDTPDAPERMIPAWKVLDASFDASTVDGRILFVGATAIGLFDLHATPLHPALPGVIQHALVVEQGLQQDFLFRPAWVDSAEILAIALAGGLVLLAFTFTERAATWGALIGAVVIPACVGAAWYAFAAYQFVIDPLSPAVTALFVYAAATLASFLKSEGERRYIRRAFSQYLAPSLVEQIAADPSKLVLGGEAREITVAFSDIRGFTTISERLDAQSLARLMNRYLTLMSDTILERGGFIDKYIGDAIMCFWNAPLDDAEHARHSCEAALAMLERLATLNRELQSEGQVPPLRIGIGMTTGSCSVGNMGSAQRFGYTAMGDDVNLASRLEGQSKAYHVTIVVAESTAVRVPDFALLELDLLRVTGKTEPVRIFTVLGGANVRRSADFERLESVHAAFLDEYRSRRWPDAIARLAACRELGRGFELDGLYDVYEERLAGYAVEPPPVDWRGVHVALSK